MKPIEELKISPWPWSHDVNEDEQCMVYDTEGHEIAQVFANDYDANIMSTAPEMYECLREAITERCSGCSYERGLHCTRSRGMCHVQKWHDALAKAAGEGQNHGAQQKA